MLDLANPRCHNTAESNWGYVSCSPNRSLGLVLRLLAAPPANVNNESRQDILRKSSIRSCWADAPSDLLKHRGTRLCLRRGRHRVREDKMWSFPARLPDLTGYLVQQGQTATCEGPMCLTGTLPGCLYTAIGQCLSTPFA